ncbi:sensor histidine kinase [soil metagenome]
MAEVSITDKDVGRQFLNWNPLRAFISAEPWLALIFMLTSFVLGVFWFVILVTVIATGFGTVPTLLGILILIGAPFGWMYGAKFERGRVRSLLGVSIADPYVRIPKDASKTDKIKARMLDRYTWQDLLYLFLLFPIGIAEFVVAVVMLSVGPFLALAPIWYALGGEVDIDGTSLNNWLFIISMSAAGLLVLAAMPYIFSGIGRGHAWLAQRLLGKDRESELEARVDELTVSRSRALDSAVVDLRRIERDLHDGAQQRLVKLSMDLGLARELMESDPDEAKTLIEEAHDESKRAMQEIRDLARGIHPAVLTDRGLQAAVSALAARSPVPVELNITLDQRIPDRVETAAYFIIAEALTNIARHSQATAATVTIRRFGDLLLIDIEDDGVGGADLDRNGGLAGMRDRAAALEGRVVVESPPGKGTLVHVELPCGS